MTATTAPKAAAVTTAATADPAARVPTLAPAAGSGSGPDTADGWRLSWPHGELAVQALGAMLGPVTLRLDGGRTVQPMYRAPWHGADDPALVGAPLLRHLNGDWLCLPFGPSGPHPGLPAGWTPRPEAPEEAGQDHGWIANQRWSLIAREPHALVLALDLPPAHTLARVERRIAVDPEAPRVTVTHTLHPRRDAVLPAALHPTFAVPPGGLEIVPGPHAAAHAYPLDPAGADSGRPPALQPGARAARMADLPTPDGRPHALMRLPAAAPAEALLQLQDCRPPLTLRWHGDGSPAERPVRLQLDWDADRLPDLLIWISQGGRRAAPWNGRNQALGIEPCASCFDLSRVAEPPAGHPLAHRRGLPLRAGEPLTLGWSLSAHPDG
ncbi:MAG: hypothetical protein RLY78_3184 [Pseudomonadota bacterium]